MPFVIKNCLVFLRNFVSKPKIQFNSFYINMWLFSLNVFEENYFCEIKNRSIYSVNLQLTFCKKGKNE